MDDVRLEATRPVINTANVQAAVAVALRNPSLAGQTLLQIPAEAFAAQPELSLVWTAASRYYEQQARSLPGSDVLFMEVQQLLGEAPDALTEKQTQGLSEYLAWAYAAATFDEDPAAAGTALYRRSLDYLRSVAEEHVHAEALRAVAAVPGAVPADMVARFEGLRQSAAKASAIGTASPADVFSGDWRLPAGDGAYRFSTGVPFLDHMLAGGHQPTEVYGLLGPFGGGKSTTATMLAVEGCKQFYAQCQQHGGPPRLVYFVSYETPMPEIRERLVAYGATITRDRVQQYMQRDPGFTFSTAETLEPYEQRLFAAQIRRGDPVAGEGDRLARMIPVVNKHFRPVDFSGGDPGRVGQGAGMIQEVAAVVAADAAERGGRVGLVLIDYVGAMVDVHTQEHKLDLQAGYKMVGRAPMDAMRQLATPLQCPVWLLHQYGAEGNAMSPGAEPKLTYAAGGRSFAANLSFLFALGNQDRERLCRFDALKARRAGRADCEVIRLDGALSRMESTQGRYVVDARTRTIVPRDDMTRVPTATAENQAVARRAAGMVNPVGEEDP